MDNTKIFAKRLKEARQKRGWSQTELANLAKTTATTVSKYEAGSETSKPSLELAISFAKELNVSLDWLCGLEQSVDKSNSITDFDTKTYLYSLVRVITEMSTETPTETELFGGEPMQVIKMPQYPRGEFITKITDLLKVYRAGSLTEDLYTTCVDKIVNDYSAYVIFYNRFMTPKEGLEAYETVSKNLVMGAGIYEVYLGDNSEKVPLFVSESQLNRLKEALGE